MIFFLSLRSLFYIFISFFSFTTIITSFSSPFSFFLSCLFVSVSTSLPLPLPLSRICAHFSFSVLLLLLFFLFLFLLTFDFPLFPSGFLFFLNVYYCNACTDQTFRLQLLLTFLSTVFDFSLITFLFYHILLLLHLSPFPSIFLVCFLLFPSYVPLFSSFNTSALSFPLSFSLYYLARPVKAKTTQLDQDLQNVRTAAIVIYLRSFILSIQISPLQPETNIVFHPSRFEAIKYHSHLLIGFLFLTVMHPRFLILQFLLILIIRFWPCMGTTLKN